MDAAGDAFKAWSTSRGVAWASALALRFDDDDDDDGGRPEHGAVSAVSAESKGDDDDEEIPAAAHTRSRGRYGADSERDLEKI